MYKYSNTYDVWKFKNAGTLDAKAYMTLNVLY